MKQGEEREAGHLGVGVKKAGYLTRHGRYFVIKPGSVLFGNQMNKEAKINVEALEYYFSILIFTVAIVYSHVSDPPFANQLITHSQIT